MEGRGEDRRGRFAETWDARSFVEIGIEVSFVQDSYSMSSQPGTLRGLHFQRPPRAQAKLVRVVTGAIYDVVVDLRRSSDTFGTHVAVAVSAGDDASVFVPEGFAHGFLTTEPDTIVQYKMSDHYSPDHYGGVRWNDPHLGIQWPLGQREVVISDRDRSHPLLSDLGPVFHREGDA